MASPVDIHDPRWQLTQRVLNSTHFEKSPRLRSFLAHICELTLTGRQLEINEQQIGVHVFGRPPGYNPGDDSIVRSQARFLRQRLEEFFSSTGRHEPIRINIPKGSYVPVFDPNPAAAVESDTAATASNVPTSSADDTDEETHIPASRKSRSIARIFLLLAVFLSCASVVLWYQWDRWPFQSIENRFWNRIFDAHRAQVIVPADSTLILIEELTGQQVSFQSYLSRDYLVNMPLPKSLTGLTATDLENSHYTSMADLNLVSQLMRLPQSRQMRAEIRYARELSISDAKEDNLILIGGPRANPWVELFAPRMNFYVDYDWNTKQNSVVNKAPQKGEASLYWEDASDTSHRVYGLICFEPSLDHEGDALLVAGTSSAGTQSAADFLLSDHSFGEFLRQIQRKDRTIPHFELLLESHSLSGNVTGSTIIASRSLP